MNIPDPTESIPVQETGREQPEVDVEDSSERDEAVPPVRYDIASYGADYDVDGYVKRLERDAIIVPEFQRGYVWSQPLASRFIESLLLGLPVPGVFLAKEPDTEKLLVIDGQQRLKTLHFFYSGYFAPRPDDRVKKVFSLQKVQERFEDKTYETLDERDRLRLDNSIIHATVVHQQQPPDDDTSIYHIFERLNSGGRLLAPQEIRRALYHGPLIDTVKMLNDNSTWRSLFGRKHPRQKDEELILRFLALYHDHATYRQPMSEFISKFAGRNKNAGADFLDSCVALFISAIDVIATAIGDRAFRLERALNAAVFDSVMVGLARRQASGTKIDARKLAAAYKKLLADSQYIEAVSKATANEAALELRLRKSTERFASI